MSIHFFSAAQNRECNERLQKIKQSFIMRMSSSGIILRSVDRNIYKDSWTTFRNGSGRVGDALPLLSLSVCILQHQKSDTLDFYTFSLPFILFLCAFFRKTGRFRFQHPASGRFSDCTGSGRSGWRCHWAAVPAPRRSPAPETAAHSRLRCRCPDGGTNSG